MKKFLPYLTLALAVCCIVIFYIDNRNPMMGFLKSPIGYVYMALFALSAIVLSIVQMVDNDRKQKKKDAAGKSEKSRKREKKETAEATAEAIEEETAEAAAEENSAN